jgi:hypothetical protein
VLLAALLSMPFIGGGAAYASTTSAESASVAPAVSRVETVRAPEAAASAHLMAARCCHITIPSNYVYNTSGANVTLHDYCSYSPDEFPAPGANANFRGACARHDMCYQYHQKSQLSCDNTLGTQLDQECTYQYGSLDPRRGACRTTADVYWAAVVIHTLWP